MKPIENYTTDELPAKIEEIKPAADKRLERKVARLDLLLIAIAFAIGYMAF